jgi:hypothetical protein
MSNDTEATYAVYCFYKESKPKEWIADGLTKEEAQAMCRESESSSKTCTVATALQRPGVWFFGWTEE